MKYAETIVDLVGDTPLVKLNTVTDGMTGHGAREARVPQPRRLGEGPHRGAHHRRRRARGQAEAGRHDRRADQRQHRRRPRARRPAARLPLRLRAARQGRRRQAQRAHGLRRRGRGDARPRVAPDSPESYYGVSDRLAREIPGAFKPDQYSNPNGPRSPLRDHRPRDLARHRRQGHALRRRRRHRRHDHRRRPVPARGVGRRRAHHRRRPRGLGVLGRHRPPLPRRGRRRGLLAERLRPQPCRTRSSPSSDAESFDDDPPARARGGPPRRRLERHGRRRGAQGRGDLPAPTT